jgi:hypothetical protein
MPISQFTIDHAATVRAVRPYVCESRDGEPVPLAALVDLCRLYETISVPEWVCIHSEQSRSSGAQRLRVVLSNHADLERVGVTRSFYLQEIISGPESAESIALAIERVIVHANELLPALCALKSGTERIEGEVDYRDPQNLLSLLENRGCAILDGRAVTRLVGEEPGPLYYGDIDLCEDGGSWELSGGPWADRLEAKLVELGAVRRNNELGAG